MKKGILLMSIFMTFLIVTLPYSFAQHYVTAVSVQGSNNIPNYLKAEDTMHVSAQVNHPTATAAEVHSLLRIGNHTPFTSCSGQGSITCLFSGPFDSEGTNVFPLNVNLYDVHSIQNPTPTNWQDQKTTTFYVDDTAPLLQDIVVQQEGSKVRVTGTVIDEAYPESGNVCVGLQSLTASLSLGSGNAAHTASLTGCSQEIDFTMDLPSSSATVAQIQIEVKDKFSNTNNQGYSLTVDTMPPSISNLRVSSVGVDNVQFVGPQGMDVFIAFTAKDNVGVVDQFAKVGNTTYPATCMITDQTSSETTYHCETVQFHAVGGPMQLFASVSDAAGHVATSTVNVNLAEDNTAPVFSHVGGGFEYDGKTYVGPGADVYVYFTDPQSGMSNGDVVLKRSGGADIPTTGCSLSSNLWRCVFPVAASHGAEISFTGAQGTDAVGNQFSSTFSHSVKRDSQAPELVASYLYSEVNGIFVENLVPVNGMLQGEITVQDMLPVSGDVDVSNLNGPHGTVPLTCEDGVCVFSALAGSSPKQTTIAVRTIDAVGNEKIYPLQVTVVGLTPAGEINPVVVETAVQPEVLDRSVGLLVNQVALVDLAFSFVDGFPVGISFMECSGLDSGDNDYRFISSVEDIAATDVAVKRKLRLTLRADDLNIDEINLLCHYRVAYLYGGELVNDHVESVPVTLKLGGTVGGLPDNYDKLLKDAKDAANSGIVATIAKLEKFVSMAMKICNAWFMIKTLLSSIQSIMNLLSITTANMYMTGPYGVPAAKTLGEAGLKACQSKETLQQATDGPSLLSVDGPSFGGLGGIVTKFCNFVTCRFSVSSWLLGKTDFGGEWFADGGFGNSTAHANILSPLPDHFIDTDKFGSQSSNFTENFYDMWNMGIDYSTQTQAQESLIMSTLNLCLPGIIARLNDYREIQCRYAVCLRDDVPQGVPISVCNAEKEYATCKYVTGEMFHLMNILIPFDMWMNQIKALLADPASMIGALWGGVCQLWCNGYMTPEAGTVHVVCSTQKVVADLGRIVGIVASFISGDAFGPRGVRNACDEL